MQNLVIANGLILLPFISQRDNSRAGDDNDESGGDATMLHDIC